MHYLQPCSYWYIFRLPGNSLKINQLNLLIWSAKIGDLKPISLFVMIEHRNCKITALLIFLLLISGGNIFSQTKLPSIIGSNMVLQQKSTVPVWGWDNPGQTIFLEASWLQEPFRVRADEQGKWRVDVPTPGAGGPYEIAIQGSEKLNLENILIGEVWLCSGQSNMEMPLKGWSGQPIKGSEDAIASADHPEIRLFTVERKTSFDPLADCIGSWEECSPVNVGDFSATAYFFGLELHKRLDIPVGLIHSSWGGTPSEAWTSGDYISRIPHFQTSPGHCDPEEYRQRKLDDYEIIQNEWLSSLGFISDPGNIPDWVSPDYNDRYWEEITVPSLWKDTRLGNYQGVVEFRMEFRAPGRWDGLELEVELGPIDEIDITWVNGTRVGMHPNPYSWNTPRVYSIPAGVVKKGKNNLAIQVGNTSGAGGIFGTRDQLKIYPKGDPGSSRKIKGKWVARKGQSFGEVVEMPYCNNCGEPHTPSTLYNGMISPLIPFRIKGAIWYQGESNRYDGNLYKKIFPNMILNWRNDWEQGDFPFYYVQIAPYTYRDEYSTGLLREAQESAMLLPYTGMVVTMDVGSLTTIHPPDKESVGKRLAYWSLARDYGKDIPFSGPLYRENRIEGDKIRIMFDYADDGLEMRGDVLKHFTIAGRDRKFVPAIAEIDGNSVLVGNPDITDPAAVRFGWGSTDQTNLFNKAGLPAGPFRTDRWNEIK